MARPRSSSSPPSTTPIKAQVRRSMRLLRAAVRRGLAELLEVLEPVLKPLFAINQASATIRSTIFVAGFFLWVGYAWLQNRPGLADIAVTGEQPSEPIGQMLLLLRFMFAALYALVEPLFAPEVFREVLVISFAFWLASRAAAIYLADIFHLPNIGAAIQFIRQAAFLTLDPRTLNRLVVREGAVAPRFQDSPINQIGGPGLVTVNLENVAVFEKVDGTPDILSSEKGVVPIEGFERLRKVIDLRDQVIDSEDVVGRTKDGIPVTAKSVRASFSIRRKADVKLSDEILEDKRLPQPLTFSDEAVLRAVYERPNQPFDVIGREEIREEVRRFIGRNMLAQFLADARDESGSQSKPSDPTMPITPGDTSFKAREVINRDLVAVFNHSPDSVIQLHWFSVGTWMTPPVIPEKHQDAWQRRMKSEMESNPGALLRLARSTKQKEMMRLLQDVPISAFGVHHQQTEDPDEVIREVLLAYREKVQDAYDLYLKQQLAPPDTLVAALKFLKR